MQTTITLHRRYRPIVRWPFRVLAAITFLAGALAIVAFIVYARTTSAHSAAFELALTIPGTLCLMHLTFYAAVRARSPEQLWWPFASPRVALGYLILAAILRSL